MSGTKEEGGREAAPAGPRGGLVPVSRRVMNLSHFLRQAGRRFPERPALVWGSERWTWADLDGGVDALAAEFTARGLRKGDRVLVQARNSVALVAIMYACFRTGAVFVPTNNRLTPDEVAYLGQASGAVALVADSVFPDHVEAVRAASPDLRAILSIGPAPFGDDVEAAIGRRGAAPVRDADVEYDDPCWFFFTSGTTGRPKAAVLTHGQMGFVVTNHLCDLMPGTTEADVSLVVAPLSHGAGVHLLSQVARGVTTVLPAGHRFDPADAWALVEHWRVTNLFTVPTIVKRLTEDAAIDRHDHSSLRYVIYAGAPMYREDQKHALAKLGPVLVQYFGLGEVTGNITVLPPHLHHAEDGPEARVGTCGFERTATQVAIQDESGREVAAGETGEICVCGPAVFAGYYDNPDANAKAFRNGWFRTGDLGHRDAEGFVYITGRASDMYISGGSNVYPREIEEKILAHPAVAEVAVVGVPDRVWGEVGIAVCTAVPGRPLDEADLLAWLDGRVARYKLPKRVIVWPELPKSAYGKITKALVRDELDRQGSLRAPP